MFSKIYNSLSRFNIWNLAESALPTAVETDKIYLQKILDASSLDEQHLAAAEALGDEKAILALSQWIAAKSLRDTQAKNGMATHEMASMYPA